MAEIETTTNAGIVPAWAIAEIRETQKLNRMLLARIVDLMIEKEQMKRQLEMLAALGIKIEKGEKPNHEN